MSAAATSAAMVGGGVRKKFKLPASDLPSVIPPGSSVSIEAAAMGKLSMGDIICVSKGKAAVVRRFVKLKMTKNDTVLLTAMEGSSEKEMIAKSQLMGKVVKVEAAGKSWDPNNENFVKKFWGKLTEYGTHKPFGLG